MNPHALHIMAAAPVVAVLLAGCAGSTAYSSGPSQAAVQPGADSEALLTRLGQIDPRLNDEASINDADQLCLAILQSGDNDSPLARAVLSRFADRAEAELSQAQLASVVEIIESEYCG